jgi:hypothetical protein
MSQQGCFAIHLPHFIYFQMYSEWLVRFVYLGLGLFGGFCFFKAFMTVFGYPKTRAVSCMHCHLWIFLLLVVWFEVVCLCLCILFGMVLVVVAFASWVPFGCWPIYYLCASMMHFIVIFT